MRDFTKGVSNKNRTKEKERNREFITIRRPKTFQGEKACDTFSGPFRTSTDNDEYFIKVKREEDVCSIFTLRD